MTLRRTAVLSLLALVGGLLLLASAQSPAQGAPHHTAFAQTVPCWPDGLPVGALPPAVPIWCSTITSGPSTFTSGPNSWLDNFDHGLSNASMGDGYKLFDEQEQVYKTQHFRHADHWMMDLAPVDQSGKGLFGGGMMRPDKSFRFENGKLVVEADVAAGVADYGGDAWTEITVTTAPAPTGKIPDQLYAYGQFGGHWSFGCRLHSGAGRGPICSLYSPNPQPGNPAIFGTGAGRVWEMSWFEHVGTQSFGGYPSGGLEKFYRACNGSDPDTNCRDRFRLELTKTSVTLYANGRKYFEQTGLKVPFPDALMNGDVYTYFSGWEVRADRPTFRFHWDRLAVNPSTGPSAAPGFGGAPLPPTATPVVPTGTPIVPTATLFVPTATSVVPPTATLVPAATATLVPSSVCERVMRLDGQLVYVPASLSECVE